MYLVNSELSGDKPVHTTLCIYFLLPLSSEYKSIPCLEFGVRYMHCEQHAVFGSLRCTAYIVVTNDLSTSTFLWNVELTQKKL